MVRCFELQAVQAKGPVHLKTRLLYFPPVFEWPGTFNPFNQSHLKSTICRISTINALS